jgi:hypothetical protein
MHRAVVGKLRLSPRQPENNVAKWGVKEEERSGTSEMGIGIIAPGGRDGSRAVVPRCSRPRQAPPSFRCGFSGGNTSANFIDPADREERQEHRQAAAP